jgi:hypothetical protein
MCAASWFKIESLERQTMIRCIRTIAVRAQPGRGSTHNACAKPVLAATDRLRMPEYVTDGKDFLQMHRTSGGRIVNA